MATMSGPEKPTLDMRKTFSFGWKVFIENAVLFIACEIVIVALWGALELFTFELDERNWGLALKLATHLLYLILNAGLWVGLFAIAMAAAEGKKLQLSLLVSKMQKGPEFLIGQLVFIALFLAGLVVLIAPGFYWAGRVLFFPFKMAGDQETLIQAFRSSLTLTEGLEWQMAKFWALLLLFNILGAALLGVGLIVTIPVSLLALAKAFQGANSAS